MVAVAPMNALVLTCVGAGAAGVAAGGVDAGVDAVRPVPAADAGGVRAGGVAAGRRKGL